MQSHEVGGTGSPSWVTLASSWTPAPLEGHSDTDARRNARRNARDEAVRAYLLEVAGLTLDDLDDTVRWLD